MVFYPEDGSDSAQAFRRRIPVFVFILFFCCCFPTAAVGVDVLRVLSVGSRMTKVHTTTVHDKAVQFRQCVDENKTKTQLSMSLTLLSIGRTTFSYILYPRLTSVHRTRKYK